jgi:hypothetical protein
MSFAQATQKWKVSLENRFAVGLFRDFSIRVNSKCSTSFDCVKCGNWPKILNAINWTRHKSHLSCTSVRLDSLRFLIDYIARVANIHEFISVTRKKRTNRETHFPTKYFFKLLTWIFLYMPKEILHKCEQNSSRSNVAKFSSTVR